MANGTISLTEIGLGSADLTAIGKLSEKGLTPEQIADAVEQAHLSKDAVSKIDGLTVTGAEISEAVPLVKNKADLTQGKNLFNINAADIVLGSFVNNTTGLTLINATYNTTGYIEVNSETTYTMSYKHAIAWYDKNKVYVGGSPHTDTNKTQSSPATAKYLRCTVQTGVDWNVFQVEVGTVKTSFVPYTNPYIRLQKLIQPSETTMFTKTHNLFTNSNTTDNYWLNYSTGNIGIAENKFASDFIEVTPNQTYILSGTIEKTSAWYDANYTYIATVDGNLVFPKTSPSNAKYIRFTGLIADKAKIQLEAGSAPTTYVSPYILSTNYYSVNKTQWYNKKWGQLGDSITYQNSWQPTIVNKHSVLSVNYGVGGSAIAGTSNVSFAYSTRVADMDASLDLITVMGGTNDWAQDVYLGAISDSGVTTFYGALNTLIGLLLTKYPNKRIMFVTPPYGELYNFVPRGWANAFVNNRGLTIKDYAEAIKLVCIKFNIPCLDLHTLCGWNSINIRSFIKDDGGLLHPNTLGGSIIGRLVSSYLDRL